MVSTIIREVQNARQFLEVANQPVPFNISDQHVTVAKATWQINR